jgi:hypothetical protein
MIGVANPTSSLEARWTPTPCTMPPSCALAASCRDRPEADRRRAAHPGGPASPAGLGLRSPLAALCPHPPARAVSLPAAAVRLQQAVAGGVRAAQILRARVGHRHRPVERHRVGGRKNDTLFLYGFSGCGTTSSDTTEPDGSARKRLSRGPVHHGPEGGSLRLWPAARALWRPGGRSWAWHWDPGARVSRAG